MWFELCSSDRRVVARAADVFGPWAADGAGSPGGRWTVTPDGDSGPWRVSNRADTPLIRQTIAGAIRSIETRAIQAMYEHDLDIPMVHAALVARDGRAVLICGPNGAGKSTLACALWRSGFILLGDDAALLDLEGLRACAAPRRVAVRASSRPLLGESLWTCIQTSPASEATGEGYLFHPRDRDGRLTLGVAGCVFLRERGGEREGACAVRLAPAHAALALLPYLNLIRRRDPGTVLARLRRFAASVPAFDMARQPLDALVASVQQIAAGAIG